MSSRVTRSESSRMAERMEVTPGVRGSAVRGDPISMKSKPAHKRGGKELEAERVGRGSGGDPTEDDRNQSHQGTRGTRGRGGDPSEAGSRNLPDREMAKVSRGRGGDPSETERNQRLEEGGTLPKLGIRGTRKRRGRTENKRRRPKEKLAEEGGTLLKRSALEVRDLKLLVEEGGTLPKQYHHRPQGRMTQRESPTVI